MIGGVVPVTATSGTQLTLSRQACLEDCDHALAVAIHSRWIAVVTAVCPDEVILSPVLSSSQPPHMHAATPCTDVPSRVTDVSWSSSHPRGGSNGEGGRRVLAASSGPLRAIRFSCEHFVDCHDDGYAGANARGALLLIAAAPQAAYIWAIDDDNRRLKSPQSPLVRLINVQAPPPAVPVVSFDESGKLAAIGCVDAVGTPELAVFRVSGASAGEQLLRGSVPGGGGTRVVTACDFLTGDCAYVLIVAVHDGRSAGRILAYDLRRGMGDDAIASACALARKVADYGNTTVTSQPSAHVAPCHETGAMSGAPFLALAVQRSQGSVFLLGGLGVVRILQLQETPGCLTCSQLAEIPLGDSAVPMWLRADDAKQATGIDEAPTSVAAAAASETNQSHVLALEVVDCRVSGAPASLGLCGMVALAVADDAIFAVWGHRRCAERLGAVPPPINAAAACSARGGGTLLGAFAQSFVSGVELVRLPLGTDVALGDAFPAKCKDVALRDESKAPPSARPISPRDDWGYGLGCFENLANEMVPPTDPPICSVTSLGPIPDDSALGRALAPPAAPTPTSGACKRRSGSAPGNCGSGSNRGSGAPKNQPVTFHKKVKSAGYGPPTEPPRVAGRPRLSASQTRSKPDFGPPGGSSRGWDGRPRSAAGGCSSVGGKSAGGGALSGIYTAANNGPPIEQLAEHALTAYGPVTDLCYTPQATHLIVTGSDRTLSAYKLPLTSTAAREKRPLGMAGHEADVLTMCPSYGESHSAGGGGHPLLLTAGSDRTARLWALGGPRAGEDLICFNRLKTNSRPVHREENPALEQVQDAQFMCLDGAIALATGARVGIYRYQLHVHDTQDDIKRLQQLGSYKCCGLLSLPRDQTSGQTVVALAANNGMMSGIVVVASSSKKLLVWDMAAEKMLASVAERSNHTRPITCLRLAQPHPEFQSTESMDLFYTAAMDGMVKLWDLRSMQECSSFEGAHQHSCHRLRCRLSPCLRYMCMPSEDGAVCVYDVRTSRVLGSRHCHRDVVVAADMHPRSGGMVSGSFDGTVRFFRAEGGDSSAASKAKRPPGGVVDRRGSGDLPPRPGPRLREVQMGPPPSA
eukprot:TRINITY_DN32558_c0_g1_i1.p1 TRINITY_DN32558_c0_g1~~TRINITY_DN32558_c0_g1_i1.p1  ORF type:complete len:1091 (+),score=126.77 TRINITY_DN32558_c0_g1_i1:97-3369(+)